MAYAFGEYRLDVRRWQLLCGGRRIPLEPKILDLLRFLIEHRAHVVSKEELLAALWPDAVVSDTSLQRAISLARRALRDDARDARWIRTEARRGYRFVGDVRVLDDGDTPAAEPPASDEPFVGRGDVLAALGADWEAARAGGGRCVVVSGEAGIGKTRLAAELAGAARRSGGQVLSAWCSEREGAPGYWPFAQILRQLGDGGEARAPEAEQATRVLGELAALEGSQASGSTAQAERFHVLERLARLLLDAARRRPRLLILDDLHWADPGSLHALDFLVRGLGAAPLMILLTCRDDEIGPSLAETLALAARSPGSRHHWLSRLSREDVELYLARIQSGADPRVARLLYERSEGNPLFVRELARDLLAHPRADGEWGHGPPASLRALLRTRLARLPAATREILGWAAVLGREFDLPLLVAVSGSPATAVAEALEVAQRAGVLQRIGSATRFGFAHALFQEALGEGLGVGARARRHLRVAELLASRQPASPGLDDQVAAHHLEALRGGLASERTLEALRRVARRAELGFAFHEAGVAYQRMLEALDLLGLADPEQRLEVLLALALTQSAASRVEEAVASAERAAGLARELGDAEGLARAALAVWPRHGPAGASARGLALAEEAEGLLRGQVTPLRGAVLARLSHYLMKDPAARERRLAVVAEARAIAAGTRDEAALAWILHGLLTSSWGDLESGERARMVEALTRASPHAGYAAVRVVVSPLRLTQLVEEGRFGEVEQEIQSVEQGIVRQRGEAFYGWYGPLYRGMRSLLLGRLAEAEASIQAALAAGVDGGLHDPLQAYGAQLFQLRIDQGRSAELEPAIGAALARFPLDATLAPLHAYVLCEAGRLDEARLRFAQVTSSYDPATDPNRTITLTILANVCAALGQRSDAGRLREALLPLAERVAVNLQAWVCMGSLHWPLGRLAAVLGDAAGARRHLARAIERNEAIGARTYLNRARIDLAVCLLAAARDRDSAARDGDFDEARRLLDAARDEARTIGMRALAERAEALLARAGAGAAARVAHADDAA